MVCSFQDGDEIHPGDAICEITGKAVSLLSAERVALNFLSFLSGVATATRRYVELAEKHGKAKILDTRKTVPGYRELSKYAVRAGGGENHRMGLYDMILIKDNHIDLAGSIPRAIEAVRRRWNNRYRIEVECRTLGEVEEALDAEADIIMLDNMALPDMLAAVALTRARLESGPHARTGLDRTVKLEASGNVTLDTVGDISAAGVDFISVGAITHSAKALDFSLRYRRDDAAIAGGEFG
jgi:nicotinate-nucleotide pyrophosphorylase (carboxylating)